MLSVCMVEVYRKTVLLCPSHKPLLCFFDKALLFGFLLLGVVLSAGPRPLVAHQGYYSSILYLSETRHSKAVEPSPSELRSQCLKILLSSFWVIAVAL
jgi:hypothetical protein